MVDSLLDDLAKGVSAAGESGVVDVENTSALASSKENLKSASAKTSELRRNMIGGLA